MKRALVLLSVAIVLLLTIAAASSRGGWSSQRFTGLWEGVDVNDGSWRLISITDRGDGTLDVASRDSYWTLCEGDRGLELAKGSVGDDGVLVTDGQVTCFDNGIEIPIRQTYQYTRREDTILATPLGTGLIPITLHRLTARPASD